MLILGVNASHDAGAAIICEGRILAAVNEERLNRKKSWAGLPVMSIECVMKQVGVNGEDIDGVAVANMIQRPTPPPMRNDFRRTEGNNWDLKLLEVLDRLGLAYYCFGTKSGVEFYRRLFNTRNQGKKDGISY